MKIRDCGGRWNCIMVSDAGEFYGPVSIFRAHGNMWAVLDMYHRSEYWVDGSSEVREDGDARVFSDWGIEFRLMSRLPDWEGEES